MCSKNIFSALLIGQPFSAFSFSWWLDNQDIACQNPKYLPKPPPNTFPPTSPTIYSFTGIEIELNLLLLLQLSKAGLQLFLLLSHLPEYFKVMHITTDGIGITFITTIFMMIISTRDARAKVMIMIIG